VNAFEMIPASLKGWSFPVVGVVEGSTAQPQAFPRRVEYTGMGGLQHLVPSAGGPLQGKVPLIASHSLTIFSPYGKKGFVGIDAYASCSANMYFDTSSPYTFLILLISIATKPSGTPGPIGGMRRSNAFSP